MKKITLSLAIAATLTSSPSWSFFEINEPDAIPSSVLPSSQDVTSGAQPGAQPESASPKVAPLAPTPNLRGGMEEWVSLDRKNLPHVKEVGEGQAEVVKGFGRKQPLNEALRLIAPKGWKGYAHRDVGARDLQVDWRGGKPWTEVLESLGQQNGLNFEVDWRARKVLVTRAPQPVAQSVSLVEEPKESSLFTLRQGEMLSGELARWGRLAGWSVRWEVDYDYRIEADATFGTDLIESLRGVINAYQSRGGLYGVVAKVSKSNKVISIERVR
ncbi:MAG: toxin co-regulated pilus biosynthesis Q family protein [Halothiobacillaceae bacterium]